MLRTLYGFSAASARGFAGQQPEIDEMTDGCPSERLGCGSRCRLLPVFLQEAANRVGRLGATRDPILGSIQLEAAVMACLLRIVSADDLDKLSVPRAAFIRYHYLVVGAVLRAFSA